MRMLVRLNTMQLRRACIGSGDTHSTIKEQCNCVVHIMLCSCEEQGLEPALVVLTHTAGPRAMPLCGALLNPKL